jgi:hypothetical protein
MRIAHARDEREKSEPRERIDEREERRDRERAQHEDREDDLVARFPMRTVSVRLPARRS